ncbi:MAG: endonuclease/exonuclease/phosphatase family protein [Gammaproteobacteria bacterium]
MAFTVLSWNVEHFHGLGDPRSDTIAAFIRDHDADLIAIYELESSHGGFLFAQDQFPGFFTFITEGQNNQEVLIMANPAVFEHLTVTQQHKFRIGNPYLRPGALATVTQGGVHTNVLFLHSASGTGADAFGDRFEINEHVFNLNRRLQELEDASGIAARLVVTGDFNTMGLQYPRGLAGHRIQTFHQEIAGVAHLADRAHLGGFQGMGFAPKEHDLTFSNLNDRQQSDLDHVLVSAGVALANRGNRPSDGTPFEVSVQGWIQQPSGAARNDFIDSRSDHCALIFTIE